MLLTSHLCDKNRCLENEERKGWFIAPAPAIAEIPAAEELQSELEKSSANTHMGKVSQNRITESLEWLEKTFKMFKSTHKLYTAKSDYTIILSIDIKLLNT